MVVQFTATLDFNHWARDPDISKTTLKFEKIKKTMLADRLPQLHFFEEIIDKRRLQNEVILSHTRAMALPKHWTSIKYPIGEESFAQDQTGKILGLDIEKIKPKKNGPISLYVRPDTFYCEALRCLEEDNNYVPEKNSGIFWDIWEEMKLQLR